MRVARGLRQRMRGLLGTTTLPADEGLLIPRCRQVHTVGMAYPIDVVFVDRGGVVLSVETLAPGRKSRRVWRARSCIELAAGRANECGVAVGAKVEVS